VSQSLPLKDQLKLLEHVQEIDFKIDQLKKKRNELPAELKVIDQNLSQLRTALTGKQSLIEENEKILKQVAAAVELNNDRQERSSKKLEGVQNTVEFAAATKEIDQLKKMNTTLDEQKTKLTADIEAAKKEIETIEASVAEAQGRRDAQATDLASTESVLNADLQKLESDRAGYTKDITPSHLARYDRVRQGRGGIGMAAAIASRCKACNMLIPPQMFNELLKFQNLTNCPSCQRVLFIPE